MSTKSAVRISFQKASISTYIYTDAYMKINYHTQS